MQDVDARSPAIRDKMPQLAPDAGVVKGPDWKLHHFGRVLRAEIQQRAAAMETGHPHVEPAPVQASYGFRELAFRTAVFERRHELENANPFHRSVDPVPPPQRLGVDGQLSKRCAAKPSRTSTHAARPPGDSVRLQRL